MKKILPILILMLIFMGLFSKIYAKNFENLKLSVDIPEEYYDLKEAIEKEDSKVAYYEAILKTTKQQFKNEFSQNNICYYGLNKNLSKELTISEKEDNYTKSIFHLQLISEKQIEELIEQTKAEAKEQQITVKSIETYNEGSLKWIKSVLSKDSNTIYQYYTIVNGKGITFSLNCSYSNVKNDELKEVTELKEKK